jgi:predicted acyl esterase
VLRAGSVSAYAAQFGLDQLNFTKTVRASGLRQLLAATRRWIKSSPSALKVPTMTVVGYWDQEDIYGAYAVYRAGAEGQRQQQELPGGGPVAPQRRQLRSSSLGVFKFTGDTALEFRRDVMQPFLDQYLKDGAPAADTPPVLFYQTGVNRWQKLPQWPVAQR